MSRPMTPRLPRPYNASARPRKGCRDARVIYSQDCREWLVASVLIHQIDTNLHKGFDQAA
jgi:hypothetical protein